MKLKCALFSLVLATSTAAIADWQKIDFVYQDETTYLDFDRIRIDGDRVYYWELSNFSSPHRTAEGKLFSSTISQSAMDCHLQTQATIFMSGYAGLTGQLGPVWQFTIPPNEVVFSPVVPHSFADTKMGMICKGRH